MSSKFNSPLAEKLYELAGSSFEDDSLGDANTFGWYALFEKEMVILTEDSQGFVMAAQYYGMEALQTDWAMLQEEWDKWNDGIEY